MSDTLRTIPASARGLRKPLKSESGFTLIEVLVAMLILSVALMGVAGGMAVAVSADTHAGEQTRALAIASQRLEEMKAMPYADVKSESSRTMNARGLDASGPYWRAVNVEEGAEGPNTKGVRVTVGYGAGREGARLVELYTVLYSGS